MSVLTKVIQEEILESDDAETFLTAACVPLTSDSLFQPLVWLVKCFFNMSKEAFGPVVEKGMGDKWPFRPLGWVGSNKK